MSKQAQTWGVNLNQQHPSGYRFEDMSDNGYLPDGTLAEAWTLNVGAEVYVLTGNMTYGDVRATVTKVHAPGDYEVEVDWSIGRDVASEMGLDGYNRMRVDASAIWSVENNPKTAQFEDKHPGYTPPCPECDEGVLRPINDMGELCETDDPDFDGYECDECQYWQPKSNREAGLEAQDSLRTTAATDWIVEAGSEAKAEAEALTVESIAKTIVAGMSVSELADARKAKNVAENVLQSRFAGVTRARRNTRDIIATVESYRRKEFNKVVSSQVERTASIGFPEDETLFL